MTVEYIPSRSHFIPSASPFNRSIDKERAKAQIELVKAGGIVPSLHQIEVLQARAVERARKLGITVGRCWEDQTRRRCYEVDIGKCPASCPRAFNYAKLDLLPMAAKLLEEHSELRVAVTLIVPAWRYPVGQLATFDTGKAMASLRRWLRAPGLENIRAAGTFEVSLNVELDGSRWWQGHWHGVIAGATDVDIKKALKMDRTDVPSNTKLLRCDNAHAVAGSLCYAAKGDFDVREAYVAENGRQNQRKATSMPHEVDEYQRFVNSLRADALLSYVGMKRVHGKLVGLGKKTPKS